MLEECIASQSEVIRAIVSGYSPCCMVAHRWGSRGGGLPRGFSASRPTSTGGRRCRLYRRTRAPAQSLRGSECSRGEMSPSSSVGFVICVERPGPAVCDNRT